MFTPQFVDINKENISIKSLVALGEGVSENVNMRILDSAGRKVNGCEYKWVDDEEFKGWYDPDYNELGDVSFSPGQGLWVYGLNTTQQIQMSGSVPLNDVVVNLRMGGTATGNPFPVALSIHDILAIGDKASEVINIRVLDSAGRTIKGCEYKWVDDEELNGWYDSDYNELGDVKFNPGQGLWVYGDEGLSIRLPAPEL